MNGYEEWRRFYEARITNFMGSADLQDACGRLSSVDAPSAELLLVHAMREIELLELELDGLKTCLLFKETP